MSTPDPRDSCDQEAARRCARFGPSLAALDPSSYDESVVDEGCRMPRRQGGVHRGVGPSKYRGRDGRGLHTARPDQDASGSRAFAAWAASTDLVASTWDRGGHWRASSGRLQARVDRFAPGRRGTVRFHLGRACVAGLALGCLKPRGQPIPSAGRSSGARLGMSQCRPQRKVAPGARLLSRDKATVLHVQQAPVARLCAAP